MPQQQQNRNNSDINKYNTNTNNNYNSNKINDIDDINDDEIEEIIDNCDESFDKSKKLSGTNYGVSQSGGFIDKTADEKTLYKNTNYIEPIQNLKK
jgi:hypothetical protein